MDRLLTPDEAAELLKLNPYTVRRLLRTRELEGFQVGRHWRIPESAIGAWIEAKRKAARTQAEGRKERAG